MEDFDWRSDDFEDGPPAEATGLDLSALNDSQREAVEHLEGPLLILAGPGSGKTRVVTHRMANLIAHGVSPHEILGLTFTNKAADEMSHRVRRLTPGASVWVSTFHRFCSRILREHASLVGLRENYSILDMGDAEKILRESVIDLDEDMGSASPATIGNIISTAKNNLLSPERFAEVARAGDERLAARLYPRYQESLQTSNSVDFDDLLMYVAELLRDSPEMRSKLDSRFKYVMVDEYQDTNFAQYAIVRGLSQDFPNLAVTGDPDQSIYGWRGASISNILNFEDDYPNAAVIRLEHNYRSTPNVLRVADSLIAHNRQRKAKRLIPTTVEGDRVRLVMYPTYVDEAMDIADRIAKDLESGFRRPSEIAIFYRMHSLSRVLERALMERGIAYRILNGAEFYQRTEVKDVLAFLNLLNNPQNGAAFLRIVNTPARGIGKRTIDRLKQHAADHKIALLDAAREAGVIAGLPKRSAVAVAKFVTLYDQMRESLNEPVEVIMNNVMVLTGYEAHLNDMDQADETERLANARELISSAREYDSVHPEDGSLDAYLEQVSLVSDTDGLDRDAETVTLMSLHSAKGLEYPSVYIMAIEEEILPHRRSRESFEELEEERRLLFVGITRAEQQLQLSLAGYRMKRGTNLPTVPSMFLNEIDRDDLEIIQPSAPAYHDEEVYTPRIERAAPPTRGGADSLEGLKVMTAADMLRKNAETEESAESQDVGEEDPGEYLLDVDQFELGMVVNHGKHGAGAVTGIDGRGAKARISVRFFGEPNARRFYLKQARLKAIRSADVDGAH